MSRTTLAVIGGGSVNWMRSLMRDIYLMDELDGGEIRLVDPNREHAESVAAMLAAFNRMRGKDYAVSIVEDRREALTGANFVMTTFSPGTMDAYFNDLEIPVKYGIRQPTSMTVGPSGISAALRTAPVGYEIVQDMEAVCPGAWLLNVTNPMSVVTRAMNLAARTVRVVGLCHELHKLPRLLGPILGLHQPKDMDILDYLYHWLPEQGFDYTVAGINHFIWLTRAQWNGEDVLPRIREFARQHERVVSEEDPEDAPPSPWNNHSEATLALTRTLGCMPVAGDRHLVEFWPSLCNVRNGYSMGYGIYKTTVDHRRHNVDKFHATIRAIAEGRETPDWTRSGEEMTSVVRAVVSGKPELLNLNLPNDGQISNLPRDVVVETQAVVEGKSITPRGAGELPGAVGTLCRLHCDVHELTLRSALEGSRELLVEALTLDPCTAAADFAELGRLADDLLQANRKWLPRFFD